MKTQVHECAKLKGPDLLVRKYVKPVWLFSIHVHILLHITAVV